MDKKIELEQIVKKRKLDGLLLTDGYNIHHISGYRGHTGMLLWQDGNGLIMTDSRYTEQVTREAKDYICVDIGMDGYAGTLARLLKERVGEYQNDGSDTKCRSIRIGFENLEISYRQYKALVDTWKEEGLNVELIPLDGCIDALRQIKTAEEIEKLATAERIGDQAFERILVFLSDKLQQGEELTEQEVALELEYQMRKLGAEGLSFDTIAASGKNSSLPHAMPSAKKLKRGDFLTMDFGCMYQGYCSDMTRTIFIGEKPSKKQREIYDIVLSAQLAALDMVKPGIRCSDVDACARDIIAAAGYGNYFGHGLGHSVGLYIHEEPRFSRKCEDILQPSVVITVEPGIYLPGEFGVRIEDMVVVTEDGYRNLASSTKDLICINPWNQ